MIDVQIKPKDDAYPMLMQHKDDEDSIVYFENPHSGWAMNWGNLGHGDERSRYSNHWEIEEFEDCTDTLELRNV